MNVRTTTIRAAALSALALAYALPGGAARGASVSYDVTADTSALNGSAGYLDFQFNPDGGSPAPATATVTGFTSDGVLGAPLTPIGDASGTLPGPLSFDNGSNPNEITQNFTFGTTLSFEVTLAGPAVGGSAADGTSFGFTLFDGSGTPYSTGPNGAIATIDIAPDGTTTPTTYPAASGGPSPSATITPAAVPEPAGLALMGLGLATVAGWARRRRRRAG